SRPRRGRWSRRSSPRRCENPAVDERSDHEGRTMMMNPNHLLNAANVMLLLAYSVRDVLWLRLLAAAASVIAAPYYVLQPQPLGPPLAWSMVFASPKPAAREQLARIANKDLTAKLLRLTAE